MKLLIASDLHGSDYYVNQLCRRLAEETPERLVLLGDLLYHGPRNDLPRDYAPKEVIRMMNSLSGRILAVQGNCEAEVDQMVLDFPVLASYAVLELGSSIIYATHGHVWNINNLPPLKEGDILLYGHTHVPLCEEKDGILCLNPGSVSIPKEGSEHSYMTLENGEFSWKSVEGSDPFRTLKR